MYQAVFSAGDTNPSEILPLFLKTLQPKERDSTSFWDSQMGVIVLIMKHVSRGALEQREGPVLQVRLYLWSQSPNPLWFSCPLPHAGKASAVELCQLEASHLVSSYFSWRTPDVSLSSVCKCSVVELGLICNVISVVVLAPRGISTNTKVCVCRY